MRNLSKAVSGLVITGVILSMGAVAMAADAKGGDGKDKNFKNRPAVSGKMNLCGDKGKEFLGKEMMNKNIENDLKALVNAGVITQDESDKILSLSKQELEAKQVEMDKVKNMTNDERKAYFESMKDKGHENKEDIFAKAVSNNIITQEKADAAKAKLKESHEAERKAKLQEGLKTVVTAGTITQEQADKVLDYVNTMEANKPSPDSNKEAKPDMKKKNPLSKLVEDGTLTQEQLEAICKVLPMGGGHGDHRGPGMDKMVKPSADMSK